MQVSFFYRIFAGSMKYEINLQKPLNVCRASAGTGKTFTLAAYYVGLLLSGVSYRSILAITFTNKATAEMRERIIGYLHGISEGGESLFLNRAREFMIANHGASEEALRRRAGECFKQMLLDYDNVQVQTIDSFLQVLFSGLAGILKMSAGQETELDVDYVIARAVDRLLATEMSATDRTIMEKYLLLQLDNESRLDVRKNLCEMAQQLYNENVQILDTNHLIEFNADKIEAYRERLKSAWETQPEKQRLHTLLHRLQTADLTPTNGKAVTAAITNITKSLTDPSEINAKEDRFRGLTDKQLAAAESGGWDKLSSQVVDDIIEATRLIRSLKRYYNTWQLTVEFSYDIQFMASLQAIIQRNLYDENKALLAQTANKLHRALKAGDASFILEKAGIRYHHVLLDEFQDTSRLQWGVINLLLKELMASEGNTILVVGDIKQSIYRWRNGDWHIMDELGKDERTYSREMNEDFPKLTRNFRSSEKVVQFNLSLFDYIMQQYTPLAKPEEKELVKRIYNEDFKLSDLSQFYQSDKKPGGFVCFRAFPKYYKKQKDANAFEPVDVHDAIVSDMFDTMEQLLQKGAQPSQMLVLVRGNKEAIEIAVAHSLLDADRYPLLTQANIVSASSFLLDASTDVNTIISALRYLTTGDEVSKEIVESNICRSIDFLPESIDASAPLYEQVSEIISLLLCNRDGRYEGDETAYINNLLDRTRSYVAAYGSNREEFLLYWDDVMHEQSIPASAGDAISIMTIHKSKGLEAQTVFIPFCSWPKESTKANKIWCPACPSMNTAAGGEDILKYLPIKDSKEMQESDYQEEYNEEHINQRIDNLNMLYVALTRARDNLYISAAFDINAKEELSDKADHIGRWLLDYTGLNEQILSKDLPASADGAVYAEYVSGTALIQPPRCSEENTLRQTAELWSSSRQVRFIQSQEGALYTEQGEEAYRRLKRMEEGTLCHNIFAEISTKDQLEQVLDSFQSRGEIKDDDQRAKIKELISSAWKGSPEMNSWFTDPWQLKREEAVFLDDLRELRPDRVMINPITNAAIVLDYKFGQPEEEYFRQVREYMAALRKLGYSPVKGYLWYARNAQGKQLVEVAEKEK